MVAQLTTEYVIPLGASTVMEPNHLFTRLPSICFGSYKCEFVTCRYTENLSSEAGGTPAKKNGVSSSCRKYNITRRAKTIVEPTAGYKPLPHHL
jgi:hypothetical protein